MNLKVRFKNAPFVIAFIGAIVGFVYQILGMFGVVAPISQDQVIQIFGLIVNILVGLGVLVNPTTKGISD